MIDEDRQEAREKAEERLMEYWEQRVIDMSDEELYQECCDRIEGYKL